MMTPNSMSVSRRAVAVALAFALGCGGSSDSEKPGAGGAGGSTPTGGSGGSAGSGGTAGSGGRGGSGGSTGGSGGSMGGSGGSTGGSGGSMGGSGGSAPDAGGPRTDSGPSAGTCPALTDMTLAVHIILQATWAGSTATKAGSGNIHIWNMSKLKASNGTLDGDTKPCGTIIPEFELSALGGVVTGGSKVNPEVPMSVWDAPTIPVLKSHGTLSGYEPKSTIMIDGTVAIVGAMMDNPMGPWPSSGAMLKAVDVDGDGKPGFTAVPRNGMGYVLPPVSLFGNPKADRLYLASRTVIALSGALTACKDISGMATTTFFDSHVVGCRLESGQDCAANQADFVDSSRTIHKIGGGTFTAKVIADGASCADVRAALPM
jgi:hypothetical protein